MIFALVKVRRGIIDEVLFYPAEREALKAMNDVAKTMDPEHDDAALFGPDGLVVNAKNFMDENDNYDSTVLGALLETVGDLKPVYTIGNLAHFFGFRIASFDDPVGYTDPVEAVSGIGQLRKDYGKHLKLYRLLPVTEPITKKADLEKHNADNINEDFDYALVEEYMS